MGYIACDVLRSILRMASIIDKFFKTLCDTVKSYLWHLNIFTCIKILLVRYC